LYFVQIHNKAVVVAVEHFDAFSAKDGLMIGAIEMFDTLWMLITEFAGHAVFIIFVKIEVAIGQLFVFFYDFI
jgi:hypothetical protein